jgi:hypothetical protein
MDTNTTVEQSLQTLHYMFEEHRQMIKDLMNSSEYCLAQVMVLPEEVKQLPDELSQTTWYNYIHFEMPDVIE